MLYYIIMDSKRELVTDAVKRLMQISRKFTFIETQPIQVDSERSVTTREAHIIQMIGSHKDMNITGLAKSFGVTKSATSQMVARLEKCGYVKKRQSPYSNKEYLLSLTEMGRRAFHAHESFHGSEMDDLIERLSAFSTSQMATISVMLETIGDVMDGRISRLQEKKTINKS